MKQHKAAVFLLGLAVLFAALLTWKSQPVTLTLGVFAGSGWDVPSPDSYEIIDQAIEKFEASHPSIHVKYTSGIVKNDYSDWLSDEIIKGETPDVFMILPEDFDLLCSVNALAPLDSQMAASGISSDVLYESALSAGRYNSQQYALPFMSNVELLFVNTTLLEKEGITLPESMTLDDFYKICQQLTRDTDGDGRVDQFGICNYTWQQAANAYGAQLFNDGGTKVSLMDPAFVQALTFTEKLNHLCQDMEKGSDPFSEGKAAFAVMSFADYRTYAPYPWKIKRLSSFEWDVLPLPGMEEAIGEVQSIQMAISSHSGHPRESWKLLQTLCLDPDVQELHYAYSQGISPLKTADKPVSENSEVDYSILEQVMNQPVRQTRFSRYNEAMDYTNREIVSILDSSTDMQIALMEAEKKINHYLNQ